MTISVHEHKNALLSAPLDRKIEFAKSVITRALENYGSEGLAIAITGGKDSTLALWLTLEACRQLNKLPPKCLFIDEGDPFEEIEELVKVLEKDWNLRIVRMQNDDVIEKARFLGDEIQVAELNAMNRSELEAIDFFEENFIFEPESYVGNHLMKTVPMKLFLEGHRIEALITAIRWDEQSARVQEDFFSARENPDHVRIHPILHFSERMVWEAIHHYGIPFCKLYNQGFRSLGAKSTTEKVSDLPAWEQDLENTPERAGRSQGKEQIMNKLRELGYM
jgi:phosphoadenosine phosphosulfate reductase